MSTCSFQVLLFELSSLIILIFVVLGFSDGCCSRLHRHLTSSKNTHEYRRFSTSSRVYTIYSINFTLGCLYLSMFFHAHWSPTPADRVLQVSSTWTPPPPYQTQNLTYDDVSHEVVDVGHPQIRVSKGDTVERFQNVSVLVVWSWVLCSLVLHDDDLTQMYVSLCHLPLLQRHMMDPSVVIVCVYYDG